MNLEAAILQEHSKKQCTKIAHWVGSNPQRFDALFHLFVTGPYRVSQRASWPLSYCAISHPGLMEGKYEALLANLEKPGLHNAIKRNTVRLLSAIDFPEKYDGTVLQFCISFLEAPGEAVAVKAFSLALLTRLAKKYPAIIPEIKLMIEDQWPYQTAAFKSRARAFLQSCR